MTQWRHVLHYRDLYQQKLSYVRISDLTPTPTPTPTPTLIRTLPRCASSSPQSIGSITGQAKAWHSSSTQQTPRSTTTKAPKGGARPTSRSPLTSHLSPSPFTVTTHRSPLTFHPQPYPYPNQVRGLRPVQRGRFGRLECDQRAQVQDATLTPTPTPTLTLTLTLPTDY